MTDTFLDDHETIMLTRELRDIARWIPELSRIAYKETSPPEGKAARNPNVPGSRPPLNLSALHLADDITTTLWVWCLNLASDAGLDLPARHPADTARHLALHADRIAQHPWARTCYNRVRGGHNPVTGERIPSMHHQVRRMVDPPGPSTAEERGMSDLEVKAHSDSAFGSAGDMVVVHYAVTGKSLSESTLRSWRRKGKLPERYGPGAEPWYWYPEVAEVAANAPTREGGIKKRTNA